jgi:hypothetical protein
MMAPVAGCQHIIPAMQGDKQPRKATHASTQAVRQELAHREIPQPAHDASRETESTCASQQKNVEWNLHHHHHHHHMVVATNF